MNATYKTIQSNINMSTSTFESLSNELLLLIFNYFSSLDLYRAFFDIKNVRIKHLLYSMKYSLNVSLMRHKQLLSSTNVTIIMKTTFST